jgi:putative chitinase
VKVFHISTQTRESILSTGMTTAALATWGLGRPDGASFKGRGFVQLTGRANYAEHGARIGLGNGLIENPELANDPEIAAKLLASFLKRKEQTIRNALAENDLRTARKAVNGGSHGLENFIDAFNKGKNLIA